MRVDVLPYLRSPIDHEPLGLAIDRGPDGWSRSVPVGVRTGHRFAFREGIPMLLGQPDGPEPEGDVRKLHDLWGSLHELARGLLPPFSREGGGGEWRQWIGELEVAPGQRVLQVPSGRGARRRELPATARHFLLDRSWRALDCCRTDMKRHGLETEFSCGAPESLPFVDAAFDLVFHVEGSAPFADVRGAVREMVRVAKPGARILLAGGISTFAPPDEAVRHPWSHPAGRGEIAGLVPPELADPHIETERGGRECCLILRKPGVVTETCIPSSVSALSAAASWR